MPRNNLDDPEATLVRLVAAAASDDPTRVQDDGSEDARLSIKAQLAGVIRGLFKAPPGQVFAVADLSQIEPRVLCWLAGQQNKLDAYAAGEDPYPLTAAALGSDDRQLGKLFDISAGYGASWRVPLQRAKGFGVALNEDEARAHIVSWRDANPRIVAFWHALHQACCQAMDWPLDAGPVTVGALAVWRTKGALRVKLPSGRDLIYRNPRLLPQEDYPDQVELFADLPWKDGKLRPAKLWHGALIENVTQAIACDVLTHAMLQLHRDGVPIVATVHDEIVAVVPAEQGEATLQRMLDALRAPMAWAPGLPLAAEGYVNRRYLKPKDPENEQPAAAAEPDRTAGDPPGGGHRTDDVDTGLSEGVESVPPAADRLCDRDAALAAELSPPILLYEAKNGTRAPGIHDGAEILAERITAILGVEQVAPTVAATLVAALNAFRQLIAAHAREEARA